MTFITSNIIYFRWVMMANWKDLVLEKLGSEEHGITKQSLQTSVNKKTKVSNKKLTNFIDCLLTWGIIETFKAGSQKKYRLRTPKMIKEKGDKSAVVFGIKVPLHKLKDSAYDAYRMKTYTTDDIHVREFLLHEEENLMIKIALLDHIEEQVRLNYPKATIERKNKLALEVN
jgi:hypothetical protein